VLKRILFFNNNQSIVSFLVLYNNPYRAPPYSS
jgi:hypothetical protein